MKQTFASNQFLPRSNAGLREQYARIAAGTRTQQWLGQFRSASLHSHLVPVNIYENNMSEFAYMLRLLKSLADSNKWITLIAPPSNFSLSLFAKAGIDVSKIRIAHPTAKHTPAQLMEKALLADTSIAVIGFGELEQFSTCMHRTTVSAPVFVVTGLPEQLH